MKAQLLVGAVVIAVLASGCSVFAMRDASARRPSGTVTCTADTGPPILDALAAVAVAGLAISIMVESVHCSDRSRNCEQSKVAFGVPMSAVALAYTLSAVHGFRRVARCRQQATVTAP